MQYCIGLQVFELLTAKQPIVKKNRAIYLNQ